MRKFVISTLLAVMASALKAVTIDVNRSWINETLHSFNEDEVAYITDTPGDYTFNAIIGPVEYVYARVDSGLEITKWSWQKGGLTGDEQNGYHNAIVTNSPTIPWQKDWGSNNEYIYLGVHLDWLKYTINFDPNGATGTVKALNGVYNTPTSLPTTGLTRTGYTFLGWSRSKEATSPDSDLTGTKDFGKIFNFTWDNKTTTLYAVWSANAYDITYDANGGTFADGAQKKSIETPYNSKYNLPAAPTRGGYTFGGSWTNATLRNVTSDTKMLTATNHTLYATWNSVGSISVQTAKVADEPGADGSVSGGGSFAWGDTCHLNATKSTGSVFVGWSKNDENGKIVSTAGSYPVTVTEKAVYYAHFKLEEYSVTFKYRNSTGELITDKQTIKYGHAATAPTVGGYPHYAFQKWDTADYLSVKGDLIVNAVYTSTVLTVSFNANGGTVTANDRRYDIGDKYGELPVPERAGYDYGKCWWTDERYGVKVTSDTVVSAAGNQTLYAHWTANKYKVTFDANGGSAITPTEKEITFDSSYGTLPTSSRDGYTFGGWKLADGATVTSATVVKTASDHTLIAVWTANKYWVTFNGAGGTVSQTSLQVTYDAPYPTLPTATRDGYEFTGWKNSVGEKVHSGERVAIVANDTFTAQWSAKTYTVTFDPKGGEAPTPTTKIVTYDSGYGALAVTKRAGYTFSGWFTEETGGTKVEATTRVKITESQTLYAHWTANKYTVTFDSNDGSTTSTTRTVTFDSEYGSLPSVTRTGYTFSGWYTERTGGEKIEATTKVKITGAQTLYAHWQAKTYTVTFDANEGVASTPATKTVTYDLEYGELATTARTGYTFDGWYTDKSGGTKIEAKTQVKITGDQTLFAHWKANAFLVTFDANGGEAPSKASMSVTYGSAYGTLATTRRTGYKFDGWFDDDSELINSSMRVTKTEDHTLTARWTANTYRVTLNGEGGSVDPSYIEVTYDKSYEGLKDATRTGYSFLGWFLSTEPDAAQVKKDDKVNITANQILYAHWKANVYKLTFDPKGGTLSQEEYEREQEYDAVYGQLPEPVREHYKFKGWYDERERLVYSTDKFDNTADKTLVAKWEACTYQVYFMSNGDSGSTSSMTLRWDESKELTANGFRKTGYGFNGWDTSEAGVKVVYTDRQVVGNLNNGNNLTLYAVWTPNTYTVQFEKGSTSASGSMSQTTLKYDESYTLPANQFVNGGRSFGGWRGSDYRQYAEGQVVSNLTATANATFTFTAMWEDDFTVRFSNNGGSGEMVDQKMYVSQDTVISSNQFTRVGYTFKGWAISKEDADAGKIEYVDGAKILRDTYKAGITVELYAVWKVHAYKVRFYPNGGSGEVKDMPFVYGESKKLTKNWFSRNGFDFGGWSIDPEEGVRFQDEEEVSNLTDKDGYIVKLFATWKDTFDSDISKWADCAETVPKERKALELKNAPENGMVAAIKSDDAKKGDASVKLAPGEPFKSSAITCDRFVGPGKLTFCYKPVINANGNYFEFRVKINNEDTQLVTSSASSGEWLRYEYTLADNEVWTELRWSVTISRKEPTDYALVDDVCWNPSSWDLEAVGVTFRLNDGTESPEDIITNMTCKVGEAIVKKDDEESAKKLPPLPEKEGVTALGWSTNRTASVAMDMTTWVVPAADTQLYAVWSTSENPEPTVADCPVIGEGFAFTTDKRFDYIIWKKNDLMEADWTKLKTVTGNGQPVALPMFVDQQGFFKVEVIQRGSK